MRHAPVSVAPTQVQYPLPEHRSIDQGVAPERIPDPGAAAHEIANDLMRDKHRLGCRERGQAVIHHVDMEALEVGDVARNVEGEYLTLALLGLLVAIDEALQDEAALMRAVALAHEVLTRTNRLDGPAQLSEHVLLVLGEDEDTLQLVDER